MKIVATHTNVIVPEVLRRGNYKRWSTLMRYYLQGQALWDIVEPSQLPAGGNMSSEGMKKNALALHAIMISCGEEIFREIKDMDSAKDVWDALADMHKPPVVPQESAEHPLERRTGPGNLKIEYETLTTAISKGNWRRVEEFFEGNPNARSATISENGYTALHFAVYNGKKEIIDYLINCKLSEKDFKIEDGSKRTALSVAARYGVGKSIAESLVRADINLLTIPDNERKIPVELACSTNDEDMIRYLYRETPLTSLEGRRGFYILQQCIKRKMFDIVFDLLYHFPELASSNCSSDSIGLILTLAQMSPPFFKGSNLSFWGRLMYDYIRVKAYAIHEDKHRSCIEKIQDIFQTCIKKITALFQSCGTMVQCSFQSRGETIQEIFHKLFKDFCGSPLKGLLLFIIGVPFMLIWLSIAVLFFSVLISVFVSVLVLFLSVCLIVGAVEYTLLVPLILGGLILVALRILVSMFSRLFDTHLYQLKLMDEYAREVIHLICHRSLSESDQNQFVPSIAVEATFQAIKNGIPDIVKEIKKANANILWSSTDPEDSRPRIQKIFACAVAHRQEAVAHLLYESEKEKNILFTTDEDENNTLHLAAKLPPHYQLGYSHTAALQLQSELRWFKALKEIVPRAYHEGKNNDHETPLEVFVREHEDLLKQAAEWAKKTAESSTVVGALIITIMFAVAFTVPGGNDQSAGFPIFLNKTPIPFLVFMVSDAISLFTASSSVLIFLGILTSQDANEDHLKSLHLIIGLTSLFISIATMTIAFCAALFIMLQGRLWVVIPITLLAGIPITCFVWLQFPLLYEIFVLTFGPGIFAKKETFWMTKMITMFFWWRGIVEGMRGALERRAALEGFCGAFARGALKGWRRA